MWCMLIVLVLKMLLKLFATILVAAILCCCMKPTNCKNIPEDHELVEFLNKIEQLVLSTTDRALIVTRNVYHNFSKEMPIQLLNATSEVMRDYISKVDAALQNNARYSDKRKLFKQFKNNNMEIDELRLKLQPLQPEFEFQLISNEFYNEGRNCTEFDNLYLEFMKEFERASMQLWNTMSERTVEEQEELLEILDEIANEKQLHEKDKLYDEFIEMYLFKNDAEVENKELF